jgi:hypothetical protein
MQEQRLMQVASRSYRLSRRSSSQRIERSDCSKHWRPDGQGIWSEGCVEYRVVVWISKLAVITVNLTAAGPPESVEQPAVVAAAATESSGWPGWLAHADSFLRHHRGWWGPQVATPIDGKLRHLVEDTCGARH